MPRNTTRFLDWMATESNSNGHGAWQEGTTLASQTGNTLIMYALTSPPIVANTGRAYGQFEVNDKWTVERIKGSMNFYLNPEEVASYEAMLDIRFLVLPVTSGGTPVVDGSYDLLNNYFTDESFMHHETRISYKLGTWLEPGKTTSYQWEIPIDVQVKRKVEDVEAVCVAQQWVGVGGGSIPRIWNTNRLRVLGSRVSG